MPCDRMENIRFLFMIETPMQHIPFIFVLDRLLKASLMLESSREKKGKVAKKQVKTMWYERYRLPMTYQVSKKCLFVLHDIISKINSNIEDNFLAFY